ncbi:MAG: hypothetical protein NVS3B21_29460 [Acidimicrobiales bacterium]
MVANIPGTNDTYTAQDIQGITAGYPGAWQGPYNGATALTLDPTTAYGTTTFRLNTSAATQFTLTISATAQPSYLFDGFKMRIKINTGAYATTVAFANTVEFQRNVNPEVGASGLTTITLEWDAVLGVWHEVGRSFTPAVATTPLTGGWITPTLPSGWTSNGAYQTVQYKLDDRTGFVEWRGVMFGPASTVAVTTTLFTLPTGYRIQAANDVLEAVTYNGTSDILLTLNVTSAGVISNRQALAANCWVGFTGKSRFSID